VSVVKRNPARDEVAIVGVGTTPYRRDSGRSELSLLLEACTNAIDDAGLTKHDIDGLSGDVMPTELVQGALGIPACSWSVSCLSPFNLQVTNAVMAVHSGVCDTVLVYHSMYRLPGLSSSAAGDPFRARAQQFAGARRPQSPWPDGISGEASAYAPWAARYFHEFGATREHLGYLAINNRTHAVANEHAALRTPLTMDDYLEARMVWEPLSVLDMEYTIDGADAFVVTTAERAKDLRRTPVLVHAAVAGQTQHTAEENMRNLDRTSQQVVSENLWARSDLRLDDIDLYFPFDGFTIIALKWFESIGYCDRGEAASFIEDNWDKDDNCLKIGGRVPVNTHGGNLSEGASQGSGHVREAVVQLRGEAGPRQVADGRSALLLVGGFFFNPGALVLRA
jgi:acetyl-CoA acetyltransferase